MWEQELESKSDRMRGFRGTTWGWEKCGSYGQYRSWEKGKVELLGTGGKGEKRKGVENEKKVAFLFFYFIS